jgi:hypothetical protein
MLPIAPDGFVDNIWLGELCLVAVQRVWYDKVARLALLHLTDTTEFLAFRVANEKLLIWHAGTIISSASQQTKEKNLHDWAEVNCFAIALSRVPNHFRSHPVNPKPNRLYSRMARVKNGVVLRIKRL